MIRPTIGSFAFFLAALAASVVVADDRPDFFLDFDSGGHRSPVRDIAFVDDGETLVSVSEDKTARVWDWQSGVTLSTLRGQIGAANEGKLLAVAPIPGTTHIAIGGYLAAPYSGEPYGDVRIFDLRTGRIVDVLAGLDLPVSGLSVSPSGDRIAATGQQGVIATWHRDAESWVLGPRIEGSSEGLRDVAFAAGGDRLISISGILGLQLWSADGDAVEIPETEQPSLAYSALTVSSDGSRFAAGTVNGEIEIRAALDGSLIARLPDRPFLPGALAFIDNERLVVACAIRCGADHRSEVWEIAGASLSGTYAGHGPGVYAVAVTPDGRSIAVAGGSAHEIHIWNVADAEPVRTLVGKGEGITAVGVAPDGSRIGWGTKDPCPDQNTCPDLPGELQMEVDLPTVDKPFTTPRPREGIAPGLDGPRFILSDITLRPTSEAGDIHEYVVLEILRNGVTSASIGMTPETGYYHSGYTLLPSGDRLVTAGSDGQMAAYDVETGAFAGAFASVSGHTDDVNSLAAASGVPLLVTGGSDQTIRLWNTDTRDLIASAFFTETDWIIWTPQGYYLSSPEGDNLIGWHVNQGRDQEARFVRARQLRRHLHSPEIVRRAIVLGDPAGAARELRGRDDELTDLLSRRPMEYSIKVLNDGAGGTVQLEISVENPEDAAPQRFNVIVNDRMVAEVTPRSIGTEGEAMRQIVEVPVDNGANQILVAGLDDQGFLIERGAFTVVEKTKAAPKGQLYLAVVGVQEFPYLQSSCGGGSCNLSYPVADAAEFLRAISDKTAPMFAGMNVLAIASLRALDDSPERMQTFADLASGGVLEPEARTIESELIDFLDLPGPDDTVILFVAGHGINIGEDYYLIAGDTRMRDETRWKRSSLVDWRRIQEAMDRAVGRRIMVLDTCHAENAYNPRLEKDAADSRIVVFSATAANNTAAEMDQLGHGVFTFALLEGLRGGAARDEAGVRLFALADFVSREVARLTSNRQEPFYHVGSATNFILALP